MDSLWSDVFVWDSPPEEELLGLLQPSEEWLGLDSQFPSLPPPWLDWELGCNDTSTLLEDGLPNYLQGEHYEGIDDASAEHDPFTAALFHSRATHPTSSDEPQIVTTLASQTQFTDCLHEFEGMPNRTAPRRRRKRFDPMRRKEVDQLRKVGACIRCRLTKTPCKLDRPCSACIKTCGNPKLGKALCNRQRMLDVRFASDLWHRESDLGWLCKEVTPLEGPTQTLTVFLYNCHLDAAGLADDFNYKRDPAARCTGIPYPWKKTIGLELKVRRFSPRDGAEELHCLPIHDRDTFRSRLIPGEFYAIPADSLPTLEELEDWALDTVITNHAVGFLGGLRASFLTFARRYIECPSDLPLKSLVRSGVRLSAFHGIWCRALTLGQESREEPRKFASQAVHTQLAVIITNGIVDLEIEILSDLQKLLFGAKGLGKQNMLPIWNTLWLLILTYRETVYVWYSQTHKKEGKAQLARHMYDMLVSIYSALFRPSSPLTRNWLTDKDLFGEETELIRHMGTLETEFHLFHKHHQHRHHKDVLLRSLVFEREIELARKAREDKKRIRDGLTEKHYLSLVSSSASANCFYSLYEVGNNPYV